MTDGIILNPGAGGSTVATDDIGGTHYQIVKVAFGAPDSATPVSPADPFPVSASALPLPVGAATAANQTAGNTSLTAIANALAGTLGINGSVTVTNFPGTQPISAAALPLPAGAATAAAQATGNSALANIDGDLGAPSDVAYSGSGSASVIAALKGVYSLLAAPLPAGTNAIGTVSISGTVPISAASLPLPAGAATAANQATTNTSLANLDADVGNITDAAAAADGTGNYSLIAAAKRALLNWADLLARIPAALGQATMAGSWPVAIASDQSALTVRPDNVQDSLTTSGSVTSATTVVSVATAGFMGGSFHVTSAGSATITYEQSNDGVNWDTLVVIRANAATNQPSTTSTAAGVYRYESPAAFVRARVSTYTSGTVAITLVQKRVVSPSSGVSLQAGSSSLGSVLLNASTNTIGNLTRQSGFTDSSTTLAANATFTGTGRVTTGANYPLFVANVFADQAGTLFIDLSVDSGTTYRTIKSVAVTAGTAAELEAKVTGAGGTATLYRVRYTNGATAQGAFQLSSAFRA